MNVVCPPVLLPVPDWVYCQLPVPETRNMTFTVTPVLFNVGINQHATIAEKLGLTGVQEKNNIDNFRLEYTIIVNDAISVLMGADKSTQKERNRGIVGVQLN